MSLYESRDTVLRGVSWQFYSSVLSTAIGGLFYIYIAHAFTTEIVGVFSLISAIMVLFGNIFSIGLGTGIQHYISFHLGRGEEKTIRLLARKFLLLGFILSLSASAVLWIFSPLLADQLFHTFSYITYLKLIDIEIFATVFNGFLSAMLLGLQNFKANALITMINWSVAYGLIIPLLLFNSDPIRIIYAWIFGYYLSMFLYYYSVHRKLRNIPLDKERVEVKPVLVYSLPIFVSGLIGYGASYVDRLTVSFFINLSELGVYNFALLVISALGIVIGPITVILLSRLSESYSRNDTRSFHLYSSKGVEVLSAVYMPIALLAAAISPSVLLFLANSEYLPGYVPMIIILVASAVTVSGNVYAVSLQAIRKTKIFLLSSSLALLSNFVLSIILVPHFGINGAAIGYASTSVVGFIVIYYFSKKYGVFFFEKMKMTKIFLSSFLMFFLMIFIQEKVGFSITRLFVFIATGLAVYLFLIRVLGVFTEEDMDLFLGMIPGNFKNLKRFFKSLFI